MTTLAQLITRVKTDALHDVASTSIFSDEQVTRWLNDGLASLWPRVFVYATDTSTTITDTAGHAGDYVDREYALPSGIPTYSHRPSTATIYRVEVGPIGGIRASDSLQSSDQYVPLVSEHGSDQAWSVDQGRRMLILADEPLYDESETYTYKLRISYVRPPADLTSSQDLEAEDTVIPALVQYCRWMAACNRQFPVAGDPQTLASFGAIAKQAGEAFTMERDRIKMSWPAVER